MDFCLAVMRSVSRCSTISDWQRTLLLFRCWSTRHDWNTVLRNAALVWATRAYTYTYLLYPGRACQPYYVCQFCRRPCYACPITSKEVINYFTKYHTWFIVARWECVWESHPMDRVSFNSCRTVKWELRCYTVIFSELFHHGNIPDHKKSADPGPHNTFQVVFQNLTFVMVVILTLS